MAAIAIGLLALCCLSSSASAGGFFGGLIPGTEPHFLKKMNATEWKKVIDDLKVMTEKRNEGTKDFKEGGPGGTDLSTEERQEMKNVMINFMQELRESETCKNVNKLLDGTRESNKFKDTMSSYPDDIFTLSGSKRKHDVWENAIGLDGVDFPKREFDGAMDVCTVTEEEFEKLKER